MVTPDLARGSSVVFRVVYPRIRTRVFSLTVKHDASVGERLRIALDQLNEGEKQSYLGGVEGDEDGTSGKEWKLWPVVSLSGLAWWTKEETEGFALTPYLPHEPVPTAQTSARLVAPYTPLLNITVHGSLCSESAVTLRYPVDTPGNLADLVAALHLDCGLPLTSWDLNNDWRSKAGSRARSAGMANVMRSESCTEGDDEDELPWRMSLTGGLQVELDTAVAKVLEMTGEKVGQSLVLQLDESWMASRREKGGSLGTDGVRVQVGNNTDDENNEALRTPTASVRRSLDHHRPVRRTLRPSNTGTGLETLFHPASEPLSGNTGSDTVQSGSPEPTTIAEIKSPSWFFVPIFTSLSAGTNTGIAKLLPQMTGSSATTGTSGPEKDDGWGKRLSLSSLGSWTGGSPDVEGRKSEESLRSRSPTRSVSVSSNTGDTPLERQFTGGLWGWWLGASKAEEGSAAGLLGPLRAQKLSTSKIPKPLLALRVALSTASAAWIDDFIDLNGLSILLQILERYSRRIGEGGDIEEQIITDLIKCCRVVMNTDRGFSAVLDCLRLVDNITFSLRATGHKARAQVVDLLSAICLLSSDEGLERVLGAFSELRYLHAEPYRFEWLIRTLIPVPGETASAELQDWSMAAISLINVMADSMDLLEDRCDFRGEMLRRGMNEVLEALRTRSGSDALRRQVAIYLDETQEDFEDLRSLNLRSASKPLEIVFGELQQNYGASCEALTALQGLFEALQELASSSELQLTVIQLRLASILVKQLSHAIDSSDIPAQVDQFLLAIPAAVPEAFISIEGTGVPNTMKQREQLRVSALQGELGEMRLQMSEREAELSEQRREKDYLERALEIVRSRLIQQADVVRSEHHQSSSKERFDAHTIASQAVASFVKQAKEVEDLRKEVDVLKAAARAQALRRKGGILGSASMTEHIASIERNDGFITGQASHDEPSDHKEDAHNHSVPRATPPPPESPAPPPIPVVSPHTSCMLPPPPPPPPAPPLPPLLFPVAARATTTQHLRPTSGNATSPSPGSDIEIAIPPTPAPLPPPFPVPDLQPQSTNVSGPPPPPPPPAPPLPPSTTNISGPSAPPPSPLPSSSRPPLSRQVTVKPIKPARPKLKPFFWSKMTAASSYNTVWQSIDCDEAAAGEMFGDLVDVFSIDAAKKVGRKTAAPKQASTISVLDITRSNNVGIMLARLRLSPLAIKTAILDCDDEILSADDLSALSRTLPTKEEAERLRTFEGDATKLAKPDLFFREISTVPRLQQRLEAMVFRQRFEMQVEEILPDLGLTRSAITELKDGQRFKDVLGVVLKLGNALNGGTFRGSARGFKMADLLKMKENRTNAAGCPTLLHYLAKSLIGLDARLVLFINDMPSLEAVARLDISELFSSINTLQTSLKSAKSEVVHHPKTDKDRFGATMTPFLLDAQPKVDRITALQADLKQELVTILAFFGEEAGSKPEDLFGTIVSFSASLQKASAEMTRHMVNRPSRHASTSLVDGQKSLLDTAARLAAKHERLKDTVRGENMQLSVGGGHGGAKGSNSSQASTLKALPDSGNMELNGRTRLRGTVRATLSRGEVDEAIRTIHGGVRRRERMGKGTQTVGGGGVRLSKMFLDGKGSMKVGGGPAGRREPSFQGG